MRYRAVHRCGFAWTEFHIKFFECLISRSFGYAEIFLRCVFFFKRRKNTFVFAECFLYLFVGVDTERSDKRCYGEFLALVNSYKQNIVRVLFIFNPRTSVRHNGAGKKFVTGFVHFSCEVCAGRSYELGNNNAFRTVDDECSRFRHKREIAEEHDLLLNLAGLFVRQTAGDAQGCGVGRISFFAFRLGILRLFVDRIINVIENYRSRMVDDVGGIFEDVLHSLFNEPFVRSELNVDQVGNGLDLSDLGKVNSLQLTGFEIR